MNDEEMLKKWLSNYVPMEKIKEIISSISTKLN